MLREIQVSFNITGSTIVHRLYTGSTEGDISLNLDASIRELEVLIEFSAIFNYSKNTRYWCDDIKLFIIYGTNLEYLRGKYYRRKGVLA